MLKFIALQRKTDDDRSMNGFQGHTKTNSERKTKGEERRKVVSRRQEPEALWITIITEMHSSCEDNSHYIIQSSAQTFHKVSYEKRQCSLLINLKPEHSPHECLGSSIKDLVMILTYWYDSKT